MNASTAWRAVTLAAALVIATMTLPRPSQAAVVAPGFDLLRTETGTSFLGLPFTGVPLGSHDFGAPFGVKATGNADTIVQRRDPVSVPFPPGSDTTLIELVSLQLVSVNLIDLGLGLSSYYVSLQSARGGPPSIGLITIDFADANGGTFDSIIDVFFDIRFGALDGPIALSADLVLTSTDVPWGRIPPPGAVLIDGVNFMLDGLGSAQDFFPLGVFTERNFNAVHVVTTATTPEPATLVLFCLGLVVLGAAIRAHS